MTCLKVAGFMLMAGVVLKHIKEQYYKSSELKMFTCCFFSEEGSCLYYLAVCSHGLVPASK